MAFSYLADTPQSTFERICSYINLNNLAYQHSRNTSHGWDGFGYKHANYGLRAQFSGATPDDEEAVSLSDGLDMIASFRNRAAADARFARARFERYVRRHFPVEATVRSRQLAELFDALHADMVANSKSVLKGTGSISGNASSTHWFISSLNANATLLKNTASVNIEHFTNKSSEALTFECISPQGTSGESLFAVYGEEEGQYQDELSGKGSLGTISTVGWTEYGLLRNGNAVVEGASSEGENISQWRGFKTFLPVDGTDPNPDIGMLTRASGSGGAANAYWGENYFVFTGDNATDVYYIAQVLNNPLRTLSTDSWGSTANNSPIQRVQEDGLHLTFTMDYNDLPTGVTLVPVLIIGGSEVAFDEAVRATATTTSWAKAAYCTVIDKDQANDEIIFALKISGTNLASTMNLKMQNLKLTVSGLVDNFFVVGTPSVEPLGYSQKDTFTLTQSTNPRFQTFFYRYYRDRFGQRYQFPSASSSETETDTTVQIQDN